MRSHRTAIRTLALWTLALAGVSCARNSAHDAASTFAAAAPARVVQSVAEGEPDPPATSFSLSNTGTCPLTWSLSAVTTDGLGWLSASDAGGATSGTVAPNASTPITLRVRTAAPISLRRGTYSGAIVLTGTSCPPSGQRLPGAPKAIEVSVTVVPAPGSFIARWTVDGEAPASFCPPQARVELDVGGVVSSALCTAASQTRTGLRAGTHRVKVSLLAATGEILIGEEAAIYLQPGDSRTTTFDFSLPTLELDGATRRVPTTSECAAAPNLVANGDFEQADANANFNPGVPIGWIGGETTGFSGPYVIGTDGTFGIPPSGAAGFADATAFSGARFVVAGASQTAHTLAQGLAAPLTPGRTYRVRAMLRAATNFPAYEYPGTYEVQLRNASTGRNVFAGRFLPVSGASWRARSFTFTAPPEATTHNELRFVATVNPYDHGAYIGIDDVSLSDVTACAKPSLTLDWAVSGRPASGCAGSFVSISAAGSAALTVPCETGRATLRDLARGPTEVLAELRDSDGVLLDRQEVLADLRGADAVLARVDLAPLALDHDGSSCAATSLACALPASAADAEPELLLNPGFEATPTSDETVGQYPIGWEATPMLDLLSLQGAFAYSSDHGFGQTFGASSADQTRISSGADGARAVVIPGVMQHVAQALAQPLLVGETYRVAASMRAARADSSTPDVASIGVWLASADSVRFRFIGRFCPVATPLSWTRRSFTFTAPTGSESYSHLVFRAVGTVIDERGVSPANPAIALDAVSLKRAGRCRDVATSFRFSWDVDGQPPSLASCPVGSIVRVVLTDTATSVTRTTPCSDGRLLLGARAAGAHELVVTLESAASAGAILATVDRPLTVRAGELHAVHAPLVRTTTDFSGAPCQPTTPVCAGRVNLLTNPSFEAIAPAATLPDDWGEICGSGSCLRAYGHDNATAYNPELTYNDQMSLIRPIDGVRFFSLLTDGAQGTAELAGESSDQKVAQAIVLQPNRRYRVRLWQHRTANGSNVSLRSMFEVRFGSHLDIQIAPPERPPRPLLATTCPSTTSGWNVRSVTFDTLAGGGAGFLVFDPRGGADDAQSALALDAVSLTDVSDCAE